MKRRETGHRWLRFLTLSALLAAAATMTMCERNSPPSTPIVSGPDTCRLGDTLVLSAVATDPEEDAVSYMFAWGDTSHLDWTASYLSATPVFGTHLYSDTGSYLVRVRAKDELEMESSWSDGHQLRVGARTDLPSVPIKPLGNAATYRYSTETYLTVSTDPKGKKIKYVFNWGDGEIDTTDLLSGADTASAIHVWLTEGTFKAKALAITEDARISVRWSDELSVVVGPNYRSNAPGAVRAADASFYHSPGWNKGYPRIQLLTIAELLDGRKIDRPPHSVTFKQAPKATGKGKKTELGL